MYFKFALVHAQGSKIEEYTRYFVQADQDNSGSVDYEEV